MSSGTPASCVEESSSSSSGDTDTSITATVFQNAVEKDAISFRMENRNDGKENKDRECYLISASWMNDFISYVFSSYPAGRPRQIVNQCLLDDSAENYNSDDMIDETSDTNSMRSFSSMEDVDGDENEVKRQARRDRWAQTEMKVRYKLSRLPLLPDLKHQTDFVIVGSHVWNLLSSEFGHDIDIQIEPQYLPHGDNSQKSLVVPIYENQPKSSVPIPESGKWDYDNLKVQMVSDDDDEQQFDDLFPDSNSVSNTSDEPPANNVIILPPSTTTRSTGDQLALVSLDENAVEKNEVLGMESSDIDEQSQNNEKTKKRKRYGSGLGNLGNTCFMNSTLQCLAHTPPLRQYFISGEYLEHLNRENPLGTGGELATEFADLLKQMWGTEQSNADTYGSTRNGFGSNYSTTYNSSSSVVYPRNFKYALGRHAEQFIGYDQHDSQELATYLLDALHEDTNRVTKKPYVEKPEQGENESDEEAAAKAWAWHLKREDSRILENCMGQIKSRVQCPKESCNRVSTTFDPSMYLSVPIPGATDRSMVVIYVSMDPKERIKKMHLTLDKNSSISDLQKKVVESINSSKKQKQISLDEIVLADVWNNEVYSFYEPAYEIDRIRDSDTTIAFQVSSLSAVQKEGQMQPDSDYEDEPETPWLNNEMRTKKRPTLDENALESLNQGKNWESVLEKFVKQPMTLYTLLNTKRSTHEERVIFLQKMKKFITKCYDCSDTFQNEKDPAMDESDQRETPDSDFETSADKYDEDRMSLEEISEMNSTFRNIRSPNDLARFEFCYKKFHCFCRQILKEKRDTLKNGVVIQVVFKRSQSTSSSSSYHNNHSSVGVESSFCTPLILRIPRNLSVNGLRQILSTRLSRALKSDDFNSKGSNNVNQESPTVIVDDFTNGKVSGSFNIVQKIPLTYEKKSTHTYSSKSHNSYRKLGSSLGTSEVNMGSINGNATTSDNSENDLVGELVGNQGTIHVHWPPDLIEKHFDATEWDGIEDFTATGQDEKDEEFNGKTSVLDCISSYCQMEQLEESEMWYCRNCKEHVRAWKQFHLYRTPPILIIHLKRFHFSATTHRRDKIDTYIDFPLKGLDLRNEVTHWKDGEEPIFDCYAVSNHYGGLGGGHYTAYAQNDDGEWCHFDDSRITTGVSEADVKSSAAYVLYYIRRDVKMMDHSYQLPVPREVEESSNDFQDQEDNPIDDMEEQMYEEKKSEKHLTAQ